MNKLLLLLGLFSPLWLSAQDTLTTLGGTVCVDAPWYMVFRDEFEGEAIDTTKWYTYGPKWPDKSDQWEFGRTHGNEGQVYLDENVVVSNGTLKLVAKQERVSWYEATRDYSSGMIYSRQQFKYGRFEIRCKVPRGMGFWPAFWTWGFDEIDVFEMGCQRTRRFYTNIHVCYDGSQCREGQVHRGPDFAEAFHIFSVEWDPYFIRWFVDGQLIRTQSALLGLNGQPVRDCELAAGQYVRNRIFPVNRHAVITNLAVGTDDTPFTRGPRPSTELPGVFEIDYIRVFQRPLPPLANP